MKIGVKFTPIYSKKKINVVHSMHPCGAFFIERSTK